MERVAVVDVGSNSGRVVVYRLDPAGVLRIVSTTRAALRLVGDVDASHRLGPEAVSRAMEALRDFAALARGAGAGRVVAVATAAMRDAENGPDLIARVAAELGIAIEVIDGEREAVLGLRGGIAGLPVENGVFFDVGGGSMQVTRFRDRAAEDARSFPLGSLRLSRAFLAGDPPTRREIRALREHVEAAIAPVAGRLLGAGEMLVGTGGTVRNLAKIDRKRSGYPITRVHGYALERERLAAIVEDLAARKAKKRDEVPGLSGERGDSIVGGALAIDVLAAMLGAPEVLVSGQGVREGLVHALLEDAAPPVAVVRERTLRSLAGRFDGWDDDTARRRVAAAAALGDALGVRRDRDAGEALGRAAWLLDVGRSMDFFERRAHAADVVLATEMFGFTHREVALTAAILAAAGDADDEGQGLAPLVRREDRPQVEAAGVILSLADDFVERCPPRAEMPVAVRVEEGACRVTVGGLAGWRPRAIDARFARVFGMPLEVR